MRRIENAYFTFFYVIGQCDHTLSYILHYSFIGHYSLSEGIRVGLHYPVTTRLPPSCNLASDLGLRPRFFFAT